MNIIRGIFIITIVVSMEIKCNAVNYYRTAGVVCILRVAPVVGRFAARHQ
jgi:hypothetical protein